MDPTTGAPDPTTGLPPGMDINDVIDAMLRSNAQAANPSDYSGPAGAMAATPVTPAQATTNAPPSIADILAQTKGAPLPPAQQPDMGMIPGLALLRFAAAVAQPRVGKQSTLGAITAAGSNAADYAMQLKAQAEAEAQRKTKEAQDTALAQQRLSEGNLAMYGKAQEVSQAAAKAPLEIENLKASIANATTGEQLKNLQIKAEQINLKYADQLNQATIAERTAKTAADKAQAAMDVAKAQLAVEQAKDLLEVAKMKRSAKSYVLKEGIPGVSQDRLLDQSTGQLYTPPMSPGEALQAAKRDIAAMKEAGQDIPDEKAATRDLYQRYLKGNVPAPATSAPAGGPPAASAPGASAAPAAASPGAAPSLTTAQQMAVQQSANNPGKAFAGTGADGMEHYYIGGREVSKDELNSRLVRAPGAPASAAPATPGIPTQAAAIGQQLDAAKAQLAQLGPGPGLRERRDNPGSLAVYTNARQQLVQRIAQLQAQYATAVGNPGAYWGR